MQAEEQPAADVAAQQESESPKAVVVNGKTIPSPQLGTGKVEDPGLEWMYRRLTRFRWSWIGRRVPRPIDRGVSAALKYVTTFEDHRDHLRKPSDLDEFDVVADEHVEHPALWVVELFPPSEISSLLATIEKRHWEGRRKLIGLGPGNRQLVSESRSSQGLSWFDLASFTNRSSKQFFHGSQFGKLPKEFHAVAMTAIQVGSGLTAVVACFHLTSEGANLLDQAWHSDYVAELKLGRLGQPPRAEAKKWVAFRKVQGVRHRLHESARGWFTKTCPGFFASNGIPLPVMDLMLLEQYDPANEVTPPSPKTADTVRALGVSGRTSITTADDLPGLIVDQVDPTMCPTLDSGRTWSLIGQRAAVLENGKITEFYGGNIAAYVDQKIRGFIVRLSITEFLIVEELAIGSHRDIAKANYRRHKMKYLDQLHDNLVTRSLDVKSAAQSIADFNREGNRVEGIPKFTMKLVPWLDERNREQGYGETEPIDANELVKSRQADLIESIKEADDDFRGVLSNAASLSSAIQGSHAARVARTVSLASLAVSATTFLLTDIGKDPKWHTILHWLAQLG